eukprot:1762477-Pleurochrysis_carterae.AAC.4
MVKECVEKARRDDNIRKLQQGERLRVQILCDTVGFFSWRAYGNAFWCAAHPAEEFYNAPYYFLNIAMYLNGDKHEELVGDTSTVHRYGRGATS